MKQRTAPEVESGARSATQARSWRWRPAIVLTMTGLAVVAGACNGALPSPSRDAAQGQNMLEIADALNQIREQSAALQEQVDSLREVVLRQDTVLRQLAGSAGITMKPPQ